jgi:hypothetical protein
MTCTEIQTQCTNYRAYKLNTHRHTDTQTHRHTDTQSHKQTNKHTDTHPLKRKTRTVRQVAAKSGNSTGARKDSTRTRTFAGRLSR